MAEKKKYNSILVSGRKDQTLTYSKYVKDEESGESVKESLDKKVNVTDELETQQIKDGAITNEKMAADSVGNTNLQDGSVSNEKLEDGSITNDKLAENSITKDKLQDKTIGVEKLDNELRQTIAAATGLPENLVETIQNVDDTLRDHQSQLDDKQSQIDDKQQQINANDEDISLLQTRSTQMEETIKGIAATGGASQATAVTYDNKKSGLTALNAQAAIDETNTKLSDLSTVYDCSKNGTVTFDSLNDAIESVPEKYRRGGLTISFVPSGSTSYVTYKNRYKEWNTKYYNNWIKIDAISYCPTGLPFITELYLSGLDESQEYSVEYYETSETDNSLVIKRTSDATIVAQHRYHSITSGVPFEISEQNGSSITGYAIVDKEGASKSILNNSYRVSGNISVSYVSNLGNHSVIKEMLKPNALKTDLASTKQDIDNHFRKIERIYPLTQKTDENISVRFAVKEFYSNILSKYPNAEILSFYYSKSEDSVSIEIGEFSSDSVIIPLRMYGLARSTNGVYILNNQDFTDIYGVIVIDFDKIDFLGNFYRPSSSRGDAFKLSKNVSDSIGLSAISDSFPAVGHFTDMLIANSLIKELYLKNEMPSAYISSIFSSSKELYIKIKDSEDNEYTFHTSQTYQSDSIVSNSIGYCVFQKPSILEGQLLPLSNLKIPLNKYVYSIDCCPSIKGYLQHKELLEADTHITNEVNKSISDLQTQTESLVSGAKAELVEKINNNSSVIKPKSIGVDLLSEEVIQMINSSGGGTIVNAPDGFFLTSVDNKLTISDKEKTTYSSGIKIIRNSEELTSLEENITYLICTDVDLGDAKLTVPRQSILAFYGGSLRNGTVVGNGGSICSAKHHIFHNVKFTGKFGNNFCFEWFGAIADASTDASAAINDAIHSGATPLVSCGNYYIGNPINIDKNYIDITIKGDLIVKANTNAIVITSSWNNITIGSIKSTMPSEASDSSALLFEDYVEGCNIDINYITGFGKGIHFHMVLKNLNYAGVQYCKFTFQIITCIEGIVFDFGNSKTPDTWVNENQFNGGRIGYSYDCKYGIVTYAANKGFGLNSNVFRCIGFEKLQKAMLLKYWEGNYFYDLRMNEAIGPNEGTLSDEFFELIGCQSIKMNIKGNLYFWSSIQKKDALHFKVSGGSNDNLISDPSYEHYVDNDKIKSYKRVDILGDKFTILQ